VAAAGDSLYVANEAGKLSVLSMSTAEQHPSSAVTATVPAGCGPARLLVSADGRVLWVTAQGSDALLGFSTAKLHDDPAHALIAKVNVGEAPLGLALTTGGSRMIVVDSDQDNAQGLASSLAVVSMARALSGKPAVLGYIPTGHLPREVAVEAGGLTALVTVTNSGRVQAVNLGDLP
jgi:DNA-binding beta-propeller fold protein YncE